MVIFNALQTSLSGGIGRYSYELAKAVYLLNEIEFKIVIREEDEAIFQFAKREDLIIAKGISNSKQRNYYEQFVLPQKIYKTYPNAIIHYPDSMAPIFAKNKIIITVHDLAFKSVRGGFTWKTTLWKNIITNLSIKKADKVIAITNFTKNEILKFYKIDINKISVVYNGFNDFSKDNIDYDKISSGILSLEKDRYILTVSTISPRKNMDGLLKAFNFIKNRTDCNLVICGKDGWLYDDVYKLVDELGLSERVIFTGGVNDNELMYLYKSAKTFVYPSFYEGFGLPPLEAMSYGIPVAVSNVTSMPEVLGDSAIYFSPYNVKEIGNSILECMNLKNKKTFKNEYSWDRCARELIKHYKD
ncbi:MAG: glycosyltransferase family 1 protein [Bacillota bacterium]|nr:glycosyltransferase family 1 protein [Bacillota bacterium]